MDTGDVLLYVLIALVLIVAYVWWWSARLDRLHRRMDVTRAALEAQLLRRVGLAARLAGAGAFDPASCLVVSDVANRVLVNHGRVPDAELWRLEAELTEVLREAFGDPANQGELAETMAAFDNSDALAELADAWERAHIAKTFYNDAVRDVIRLRSNPLIRLFHIAGRTPLPSPADVDTEGLAAWAEGPTIR